MRDDRMTALDGIGVVLGGLLAATLLAFPHVVAPHFRAMFADFGSGPLPAITRLVLSVWFPTILAASTASLLAAGCVPAIPLGLRRGAVVAAFALGAGALGLCFWGVYQPIFDLADHIKV